MKTLTERKKKRLGRPPLPAKAKRSEHVALYATREQLSALEKTYRAEKQGDETLSEWALRRLLA